MKTPTSATMNLSVETRSLNNGSVLYYRRFEEAPRTAISVYTYGGNRLESVPGMVDMIDDLLMEGTEKRSAEQIAVDLDGLSLDMDVDTRRDHSVMNATFLEEDREACFEFMADMLFHSTLAEFPKEKIRLQGELIMDLDSPRNRSHDLFMTEVFKNSPYQASHTRILECLPQLTSVEPLKKHYNEVYQPENMLFSVVGNIDISEIQRLIENTFVRGHGQNKSMENPPGTLRIDEDRYVTAAKDDSSQLHVFKGWFAPEATHLDYPAMTVLNTILGAAGLTSRLFLELRDKQGLAYNVRSQYESSRFAGLFYLYIGTEPNNREKVLKGFEVECQKLMNDLVGAQELSEAKENILGRRVVFLETASQQCSYIGNQLALGVSLERQESLPDEIMAVTAQQVQAVAQKYMNRPAVISAVGPSRNL